MDYCEFEDEHHFALCNKVMIDAGRKAGMEFEVSTKIEERLASVGFVNVHVRCMIWLIGPWPRDACLKKIEHLNLARLLEGIHGLCARQLTDEMGVRKFSSHFPRKTDILLWSNGEINIFCTNLKAALKMRQLHSYHWV